MPGRIPARGVPSAPSELPGAHTPLRHAQFEPELSQHPDKAWVSKLLHGLSFGVRLGYTGPRQATFARNLPSAHEHPEAIETELTKECAAGRILGPYPRPPVPRLHCSGLGAVPKKNGSWRMILHLSAPAGKSINDFIPKEVFTLQYASIDDAVQSLLTLGPGAQMAKVDLKSAFRMIPVHPADWELLGMRWNGSYYMDTCLPFGLRSAPFLFNEVATAIHWILEANYGFTNLVHYLDDYFWASPPASPLCLQHLHCFLSVAARLGAQVASEKVDGPATILTFLGLELDSERQEIRLPADKLHELLAALQLWSTRKTATKRQLLSLIGKLSFAARVVPAGRLFLRRLLALSTTVAHLHHHVHLNTEAHADIEWWHAFLPGWNGTAKFVSPSAVAAPDMELHTDAAGTLGCGAYFQGAWFHLPWQPPQLQRSIQWKELFAVVAAAATWGHRWSRCRIRFHCDNEAIVWAWQNSRCKQPDIMALLRRLFFIAASHNFHITLQHVPGKYNNIADALSR